MERNASRLTHLTRELEEERLRVQRLRHDNVEHGSVVTKMTMSNQSLKLDNERLASRIAELTTETDQAHRLSSEERRRADELGRELNAVR